MSSHQIRAEVEVRFVPVSLVDEEVAYPLIDITYDFVRGAPAMVDHISGGDPGWSDEMTVVDASLYCGDGVCPTQQQIDEWAQNWLDGPGRDLACKNARERQS